MRSTGLYAAELPGQLKNKTKIYNQLVKLIISGEEMRRILDLTGRKFGLLTVLKVDPKVYPSGDAKWECICECGVITNVYGYNLKNGNTKSCGCLTTKTHGMVDTPEYKIWGGIKQRCYNPKDRQYHLYGGRGIVMSEEWKNSFEIFYRDMGPRPTPQHSVEREKNDEGYNKENCRWATKVEQANNTRSNVFYTYNGVARTIAGWCRELGLDQGLVYNRVYGLGWSFEKAITTPVLKRK